MSTPHDALFKFVFPNPENAAAELRAVLPQDVATRMDWSSLSLVSGTFVDEWLRYRHTDLLFSVQCADRETLLYLVLEHQSEPDELMAFRILRYSVRILDGFLGAHPNAKRLPVVIPVVVHHGTNGWGFSTDFSSVLDADPEFLTVVSDYVPRFRFLLDDLTKADDTALRARCLTALAAAGLVVLRDGRGPNLPLTIAHWTDVFSAILAAPNGVAAFAALVEYIFKVSEAPTEDFHLVFQGLGREAKETAMTTIAERLKQEGRAEGKAQGRAEGKADMLVRQMNLRFGPLAASTVNRVSGATLPELEVWAERVLTAESLDDLFR